MQLYLSKAAVIGVRVDVGQHGLRSYVTRDDISSGPSHKAGLARQATRETMLVGPYGEAITVLLFLFKQGEIIIPDMDRTALQH